MTESQTTILHIDDDEATRYFVTRLLQKAGFTTLEAANGTAGLEAVLQQQPDLVILDVQLPDLSGFEVCRRIKANPATTAIPVLHLSASFVQSQDKAEGLDGGADGYLAQPVEPIELLATIRSLLRIRRAESAALISAQEWQTTFDAINDSVCLVDRDGKFLRCNQSMAQLFCKSTDEILGCAHSEIMHATLGIGDGACFRRAQETHQRQVLEFQANGRWYAKTMDPVLDKQEQFAGAVFILSDITERKQAEAALAESEALKQRILESSHDCIEVLTLDGHILYLNKGGLLLLEIDDPISLLKTKWLSFWHGEDQEKARAAIVAAKAGEVGQFQGYSPTAKGKPKWWDVVVTPVQNASGQAAQLLVVSRDITRRKLAEAEREQLLASEQAAREEAETANRIKDEFLAVLSHELRSPLNPILGWAKILRTSSQDEAKTQYALETIERNARLQAELIEDLLDISRILQGKLHLNISPVGLAFTVKAALETVQLAAEAKSIQLQTVLDPTVGQVLGDTSRLQQVVWNLLTNAIKFTSPGGRVEVRLEQIGKEEGDRGRGERPNHSPLATPYSPAFAQLTISDNGKGIPPHFLPYVFDYFRQADSTTTRKFGGLGLGLAIVHHLVELHGGTVQVASPGEGQGATFTVRLPILATAPQHAEALPPHRSDFNLKGLQVLLVDDDRDSREFIAFLLEQSGATVTEAGSASTALKHLGQATFAVLISDIGMPDIDGYTLIRHIRAQTSAQGGTIPAIALTAYAGEVDQQQALAAGFQQHLAKPIEPEQLMQTILRLTEGRMLTPNTPEPELQP